MSVLGTTYEPVIATSDPLAILAEAGVDVMNMSSEALDVFANLSADEARLLARVNRRLESIPNLTVEASGGVNH